MLSRFSAFGQEIESSHKDKTYKSIYLELLGASNMIGVSYDTRIKPGSVFGYRAGISYFYGTNYNSYEGHGFSVPLEFNCIWVNGAASLKPNRHQYGAVFHKRKPLLG